MKAFYIPAVIFVGNLFAACEKDCTGTYEFKGKVWNGSTNKPHAGIPLDFTFSKESRGVFSGGTTKRLGSTTTDENGNFSIVYACQNDEGYVGITTTSGAVGNSFIGSERANSNMERTFNVPDSVSIDIFLAKRNGLGVNDTLFVEIGVKGTFTDFFTQQTIPNGFYKRFRISYGFARTLNYSMSVKHGIGIQAFKAALSQYPPSDTNNNLIKLEPEVNTYTIYY